MGRGKSCGGGGGGGGREGTPAAKVCYSDERLELVTLALTSHLSK